MATQMLPRRRLLTASLAILCVSPLAEAVTFNLVYLGPGSSSPDPRALTRADDQDGEKLRAHLEQATSEWSHIIEDNHVMTINYFYAGIQEVPTGTANAGARSTISVGGETNNRTVVGEIKVYNEDLAWLDPPPEDDSEFVMEQIIFSDMDALSRAENYIEGALGSGPIEAGYISTGGPTVNSDFLRQIRHEVGHLMGVSRGLVASSGNLDDGDWDLPSNLLGGRDLAVVSNAEILSHFNAYGPLMGSSGRMGRTGHRTGIGALDVLAAAQASKWTQIDLPRKNFIGVSSGSSNFAIPSNWVGDRVPDIDDEVFIRSGTLASVIKDTDVKTLLVDHASQLNVVNSRLFVDIGITVGRSGASPTSGEVLVAGPATLTGETVDIENGAIVLGGGTLQSRSGSVTIAQDGELRGQGTILIAGSLNNSGLLRATAGGLTVNGPFLANPTVDLDGDSRGGVEAISGSLDVQIANADTFRGTMTIGAGQYIDLPNTWRLFSGGSLNLDGSFTQPATLRGGDLEVSDDVTVDRLARLEVNTTVGFQGRITLPDSNDQLTVTKRLDLGLGGRILGEGSLVVQGTFENTSGTLAVGTLDLADDTMLSGGSVRANSINAAGIEFVQTGGTLGFDKFTGELTQSGGVLEVASTTARGSLLAGDLKQSAGAVIELVVGREDDFSQLVISDTALIDGLLNVTLIGGYNPAGGEEFPVVIAEKGLSVESLALAGPDAGRFQFDVRGDAIVLEALALLAGDYNGDGLVDAADYTLWRDSDPAADGTGDGLVNAADYNVWADNYGASASSTSNAVPEPAGLVMALLGLMAGRRRTVGKARLT